MVNSVLMRTDAEEMAGDLSNIKMATRKLQEWEEVTEKMIDFIWSTEGEIHQTAGK